MIGSAAVTNLKMLSDRFFGVENIPPMVAWSDNVNDIVPEKNNRNTPFYKYRDVFAKHVADWIERRSEELEASLPVLVVTTSKPIHETKKGRCGKCNRLFISNSVSSPSLKLRHPCVVMCAACNADHYDANCCVRCQLIQWYLNGSLAAAAAAQGQQQQQQKVFEIVPTQHLGYAICHKCKMMPLTIADFRKIEL